MNTPGPESAFRYRAVDRAGKIVTGEKTAASEAAVIDWLKGRDLLPLRTAKASRAPAFSKLLSSGPHLGPARRAFLTRELAVLLGAGLKLDGALALLLRAGTKPSETTLLARVLTKVQSGAPFSDALRAETGCFPPDYLAVVRAGEASGNLAPVLDRLANGLERAHRLRSQIEGQMIYPAILSIAAIASVAILLTVVVPAFTPLFAEAGRELPPATRLLIAVASATRVGGPILGATLLGAIVVIGRLKPTHPVRRLIDRAALALPVAGALRIRLDAARFCRTLGTLVVNGVPLVQALMLGRATIANTVLADSIDRIADGVRQGSPIHQSLRTELRWPPLMAELCQVGEETGRLADMMLKLADMFDEEATTRLDRLVSLLTPTITLLLGLLVAGVLAGLLSTILSVNELAM